MQTHLECIPCFYKQVLESSKIAGAGKKLQKQILDKLSDYLKDIDFKDCPPKIGKDIYELVREMTGNYDPYVNIKKESNEFALGLYEKFKRKIANSNDRLLTAVELAIAGNIIDCGLNDSIDINKEIKYILNKENKMIKEHFRFFQYEEFKSKFLKAEKILYLADNCGEVVFDKLLLEEMRRIDKDKNITFVVRGGPIINDVLIEDALFCGIDKLVTIITSSIDAPGTVLKLCDKDLIKKFKQSDLIISKGQGNFEALSEEAYPICFLFMAKCKVVSEHLGCRLGDINLICK